MEARSVRQWVAKSCHPQGPADLTAQCVGGLSPGTAPFRSLGVVRHGRAARAARADHDQTWEADMWQGRMTTRGSALAAVTGLSVGQVAVLQAREPARRPYPKAARHRVRRVAALSALDPRPRLRAARARLMGLL